MATPLDYGQRYIVIVLRTTDVPNETTDIWISWKSYEISHSLARMLYLVPGYMGGPRYVRDPCLIKQKIKQFISEKIKLMDNLAVPN